MYLGTYDGLRVIRAPYGGHCARTLGMKAFDASSPRLRASLVSRLSLMSSQTLSLSHVSCPST